MENIVQVIQEVDNQKLLLSINENVENKQVKMFKL